MSDNRTVLVVGLGEVGKPLLAILSQRYQAVGIDIKNPAEQIERADVMHICYPFEIAILSAKPCDTLAATSPP